MFEGVDKIRPSVFAVGVLVVGCTIGPSYVLLYQYFNPLFIALSELKLFLFSLGISMPILIMTALVEIAGHRDFDLDEAKDIERLLMSGSVKALFIIGGPIILHFLGKALWGFEINRYMGLGLAALLFLLANFKDYLRMYGIVKRRPTE